ncbi:MAG: histone deacetylase [Treponema sp.]|nr:histone deacetylase [Treponema sp.]
MLPIPADRGKRVIEFLTADGKRCPVLDFEQALVKLKNIDYLLCKNDLVRVHSKKYISQLCGEELKTALLNAFELIDADGNPRRYEPDRAVKPLIDLFQTLTAQASGTYLACLLALSANGFCYYLGGGMHHARYDAPSGFCVINDIAAAAFRLLVEKQVSLVWIIDMDAHKGDGTAEIVHFAREREELQKPLKNSGADLQNKPSVLTLSIHMANGWPLDSENLALAETGRAPLLPSDIDIGIGEGEESAYVSRLEESIRRLESLSGKTPDFVFVVDGADPYEHDELFSTRLLRLTLEQCLERDLLVYKYLKDRGIPSAWIQSGGYGSRAWEPHAHFLKAIYV